MTDLFLQLFGKLDKAINQNWPSARKIVVAVSHIRRDEK
jgi:hypothetical protein